MPIIHTNSNTEWAIRCETGSGGIWFILNGRPDDDMRVSIYDELLLIKMRDNPEMYKTHDTEMDAACKNKHGLGSILRACRSVMGCFPNVKNWVYERFSGASAPGERKMPNG